MSEQVTLTADLIHGFTTAFLMSNFDNPVETPDLHVELWGLMCLDHPHVAAAAPRGHAKSTAVTHAFTLANVCFRRAQHVLIVSDTEGQAADFLRDIKTELLENEMLRQAFDIERFVRDRETEVVVRCSDGHEFRIIAKGSEQKLRGLKWRNRRPDLIIGDDLENDEIVMNEERRDKFRRWFYNALLPCGSKNCRVRVVGTILHLDSLLERVMPHLTREDVIREPLKQFGWGQNDPAWLSVRYRAHNEDFSEILWPEQHPKEKLQSIRQSYVAQGFPEGYAQEYLNYPLDEENAYFRKQDFLHIDEDGVPEQYYIAGDLAISQRRQRAFSVFVVVGVTSTGKLRVRDVVRFRGDSLEILNHMFDLNSRWKPEIFFLEQENIARTLGPVLYREMEMRNQYFTVEQMPPQQDKIKRARGMQARMRAGGVEFDVSADWFPDFQQELLQFPRGAYMDQVDAFAWIALGLDKITDAPTAEELADEEYEDEFEESYSFLEMGASSVTGY
ncbi:phage terminase large subunit [Zhongshania sp.]|uniref:phage terminase large subunit n=1 Tax=Zhongshania sp. TaxID=1971902 RepID=UPI0035699649